MLAYVGSYTTEKRHGRGRGIEVYRVDDASAAWTPVQTVGGLANPSFLALDRRQRVLYSAHGDEDYATAFAIDAATGQLTSLGRQSTGGTNGVHLAVDATNRFLVVGNYASGTVAALPIAEDGSLGPLSDLATLKGAPGPDPVQQSSSHPHDVPFDRSGRFVIVPDKGFDRVFLFRLDTTRGALVPGDPPSVASRPGAAPRHADVHPRAPYAYVNNELDSTVTTYQFDPDAGVLEPLQTISTVPADFTAKNTTAEIAVARSGHFVYVSNRGHDSVAIFAVDPASGLLSTVGWEPAQGKTPRFFALDPAGASLYVANQNSDTIVAFRVDPATGRLTPTGQVIRTPSPSSIVFRE
jgi:6-phosphogluconolactonase (cycloisomerase 2 family)